MHRAAPKRYILTLLVLQLFVGLGAVGGGWMLTSDPTGATIGIPLEVLQGSPFPDFLIPGVFLFVVNGLGSIAGALLTFRRSRSASSAAAILGTVLAAWIAIQVAIIGEIHWLHALYFALGVAEVVLGIAVKKRKYAEP